jgi:hypothetical protein
MPANASPVDAYLRALPEDRRDALNAVRKVILANLPTGYEECLQYGMIGYVVPHSIFPGGYHCDPRQPLPLAGLGSKKNHMSLHLMAVYGDAGLAKWFQTAWKASGKKLDMGKACVRFKKVDDLPLDVIGQLFAKVPVKSYLACIQKAMQQRPSRKTKK